MNQRLFEVLLAVFFMTISPVSSWIWRDCAVPALYAAPPKNANAQQSKRTVPTTNRNGKSTTKKQAPKKQVAAATKKKQTIKKKAPTATTKSKTTKPTLSPGEEAAAFQAKVADVQRHNARIAAYQNRDIAHRLGVWGQVGYSAIFPGSFSFSSESNTGFAISPVGFVGGGVGLGYQLRYKSFLFTTGGEFQMYNSVSHINPLYRAFPVVQYPTMKYIYSYTDMRDYWRSGYVQVPLLFGMELNKWYWQAGAKVGVNVIGTSSFSSSLTTSIRDYELIDELKDMYNHALVSDYTVPKQEQRVKFGVNAALAAEIGLNLEQWIPQKKSASKGNKSKQKKTSPLRYRIALFAEYGVLNIHNTANIPTSATNDMPADFSNVLGNQLSQPEDLYQKVEYSSSLATTSAKNAKLNPFMVGIKAAVFYELPRQKKKMLPMPVEPKPRMAMLVTNAETGAAIAGALVSLEQVSDSKILNKTTNKKGVVVTRLSKGAYRIAANKLGFFPCDTIEYTHLYDLKDTLRFSLTPEPIPTVYTLCGYLFDSDTHAVLGDVNLYVASAADSTISYRGTTNEDGLFVSELTAGKYALNATSPGYMPLSQIVQFEQDTLRLYMKHIKEGIKVKINHLFFATNKSIILPQSEEALNDLAVFLRENPTVTIRIIGHTDAVGSDEANMKLSVARAKAVRTSLVERGIDVERMEFEGRGKNEPVASNDTEEGRAQNRRVEFVITGTAGEDIQQVY